MINYMLLVSSQGKLRLSKWFTTMSQKNKAKTVQHLTQIVLSRKRRGCNIIEYKGKRVICKLYASLHFLCEISDDENELFVIEVIQRYVETLDRYFGNVCELDLVFSFQKAYAILDEFLMAGELQEPSKMAIIRAVKGADKVESEEKMQENTLTWAGKSLWAE